MKTMYFNQYQIESGETERYFDNHRLFANMLGLLGEVGELTEDIIQIVINIEKEQDVDLSPIKNQLMDTTHELFHCGVMEKIIRKHHSLPRGATQKQCDDFRKVDVYPSVEQIEHIESEAGDCLFHLSRLLASINVDLEHCAIKNRMKLTRRLANNEITDHKDH